MTTPLEAKITRLRGVPRKPSSYWRQRVRGRKAAMGRKSWDAKQRWGRIDFSVLYESSESSIRPHNTPEVHGATNRSDLDE